MPSALSDDEMRYLCEAYTGVVTLEIFNEADFQASVAALNASVNRLR